MKTAIITTLKDSEPFLDTYIQYHLAIGFDHMFLFFDDPQEASIEKYIGRKDITVVRNDHELKEKWKKVSTYRQWEQYTNTDLIARQVLNMNVALKMAVGLGIDWLLHIDTDELFYFPGKNVKDHFERLSSEKIEMAIYHNHEAIPEKMDIPDFFSEVTLFKNNQYILNDSQQKLVRDYCIGDRKYFHFYNNGKPAVKVSGSILSDGPHRFIAKKNIFKRLNPFAGHKLRTITFEDPCILHYACCGFAYFWRKYEVLGNFPDKWNGRVGIGKRLPVHLNARNIWRNGDIEAARLYYHDTFVHTPFRDRGIFVKERICFDVPEHFVLKSIGSSPGQK